uniref:Coiled-coil domain containing 97 n=1 Tax=Chrysemys picta bellii TaxID=8478 RepID=A0A8C3FT31_CHRPI
MRDRPAPGDVPPKRNGVTEPPRGMPEPTHAVGLAQKEAGAQEPAGPPEVGERALLAMLTAVANSPLPVRSQQKDEPDLTAEEKLAILRALYRDKPVVFLERFRRALRVEHLGCFAHLAARYEVRFYCDEVRRAARGKAGHTRVRNKRYAALQQLIKGTRPPSPAPPRAGAPGGEWGLTSRYCLCGWYPSPPCRSCPSPLSLPGEESSSASDAWVPDTEEKAFLREEFTSRMHQRFLDGKDGDFDYSEVDENPEFDNLDIVSRDEEERYFDGEESEEAEEMEAQ